MKFSVHSPEGKLTAAAPVFIFKLTLVQSQSRVKAIPACRSVFLGISVPQWRRWYSCRRNGSRQDASDFEPLPIFERKRWWIFKQKFALSCRVSAKHPGKMVEGNRKVGTQPSSSEIPWHLRATGQREEDGVCPEKAQHSQSSDRHCGHCDHNIRDLDLGDQLVLKGLRLERRCP